MRKRPFFVGRIVVRPKLIPIKKTDYFRNRFRAEREGFEPPDPQRSTVFKTAAFDRSANSLLINRTDRSIGLQM